MLSRPAICYICIEDTQIVTVYYEFPSQNMTLRCILHLYVYIIMIYVNLGMFFDSDLLFRKICIVLLI